MRSQAGLSALRYAAPFNFSAINNYAATRARGTLLGLLNDDVEIIAPHWLREMVSQALRPAIGCVGAKLYYPDGTIQHGGVLCGVGGIAGHAHKHFAGTATGYYNRLRLNQNLSAVTAACLVVRRAVFEQAGGFDARLKVAFNDVDFCLRVREAGYRNLWTPYAELCHHESRSRGTDDTHAKQMRFVQEKKLMREIWGSKLIRDPYYNPNLTRSIEDFSLSV